MKAKFYGGLSDFYHSCYNNKLAYKNSKIVTQSIIMKQTVLVIITETIMILLYVVKVLSVHSQVCSTNRGNQIKWLLLTGQN